ncbi:MAG: mycothiol synthase [Galactobacter sp.]|uniref:mycothiol synthase n=1 Tax=Galactobacter sp. TaxID=2676125 RepID=UPI0025C199F5|nr:mycothiol synthase [Galactobacter sp.]
MDFPLTPFTGSPDASQLESLRVLASAGNAVDGHPPFNDQTWAALRAGDHGVRGAFIPSGDAFAAAAVITDLEEPGPNGSVGTGALVELVVHPVARGRGLGAALATWAVEGLSPEAPLQAWSHGGHPAAAHLAQQLGLRPTRELWVMAVSPEKVTSLPAASFPDSVTLDTFQVGKDEADWLAVNAAAFDFHPEQGRMTLGDLQAREAEDWFDPEGFFLARSAEDKLLGFHWTKVTKAADGSVAEGEVYAVGIAPEAQGSGLGRALTVAGLHHLADSGAPKILLYVEADNEPAVGLYTSLGFTLADSDVLYSRS